MSNFFGLPDTPGAIKVSLAKTTILRLTPSPILALLRRVKAKYDRHKMRRDVRLPPDAPPQLRKLDDAWRLGRSSDANAPGQGVAYYSLDLDGVHFPGERPWGPRWEMLRSLLPYKDARVLELGCNMGLLSCHLLKYEGATAAMAIDHDPKILEGGKLVAEAYGVAPIYGRADFDESASWETPLRQFKPDIVFALNVLNWLSDKERFLKFLAAFPIVVVEGHDPFEVESQRMSKYAPFDCELICITERGRPLMVCHRR